MIPKASQRGGGAELAAHLLNAHQNESVEIIEIRGAVADDPADAFEEWRQQARVLTKCQKYLYSMSLNPDAAQGEFSREQALEYFYGVKEHLRLGDQPHAIIRHVKEGREHWHLVVSRIDAQNQRAIHMPFDHMKVMAFTRAFAHEHGYELPKGYERGGGDKLSYYETIKQKQTGLSREHHKEQVTDIWRRCDSARAFVRALADHGYLLATGKRPYVLVDSYGGQHALPRLIDDRQLQLKDVTKFLEKDFPTSDLPSVDQAKDMVAEFADIEKALAASEQREEKIAHLKTTHAQRRAPLEKNVTDLKVRHEAEQEALAESQRSERAAHKAAFRAERDRIQAKRQQEQTSGLRRILTIITGLDFIRVKIGESKERARLRKFVKDRQQFKERHLDERENLKQRQIIQKRNLEKEERKLRTIENQEWRALKRELVRDHRIAQRGGGKKMPAIGQEHEVAIEKGDLTIELNTASGIRTKAREKGDLSDEFAKANGKDSADKESGDDHAPRAKKRKRSERRPRRRDKGKDRER